MTQHCTDCKTQIKSKKKNESIIRINLLSFRPIMGSYGGKITKYLQKNIVRAVLRPVSTAYDKCENKVKSIIKQSFFFLSRKSRIHVDHS